MSLYPMGFIGVLMVVVLLILALSTEDGDAQSKLTVIRPGTPKPSVPAPPKPSIHKAPPPNLPNTKGPITGKIPKGANPLPAPGAGPQAPKISAIAVPPIRPIRSAGPQLSKPIFGHFCLIIITFLVMNIIIATVGSVTTLG